MKKLILASASPRRKELLKKYGFEFEIIISEKEEKVRKGLSPHEVAKELAYQKASAVFEKTDFSKDVVVLGADTIVVYNGKILGKPKDEHDAFTTLKTLSNNTHEVITGYAMISKERTIKDFVVSKVTFNDLSEDFILDYVKSGLPFGKAGSYGIQDGYPLEKSLVGSKNNVIGLPIELIKDILEKELNF